MTLRQTARPRLWMPSSRRFSGSAAQALVARVKESGRSTGELRHDVAEALRAGTVSPWEADRLEARLADRVVSPEDLSETARNMLTLQTTLTSREFAEYVNSERELNAITAEEARFLLSSVNAEGGTDAADAAGGTGAVAAEEAGNRFFQSSPHYG